MKTATLTVCAHTYRHILKMTLALKCISGIRTPGPINLVAMALWKPAFLRGGWMLVWLQALWKFVTSWPHKAMRIWQGPCQGLAQTGKISPKFQKAHHFIIF